LPDICALTFSNGRHDTSSVPRVSVTDGGVYDNLGPERPGARAITDVHASRLSLDYIIACDAATREPDPANGGMMFTRLARSFSVTHRKNQDGGRNRLHDAARSGELRGFIHAYGADQ
jgi:NTE family protein